MAQYFDDLYKVLGIDLKDRKHSDVTAEEVEAAFKKKEQEFDALKKQYRTDAKKLHSDGVSEKDIEDLHAKKSLSLTEEQKKSLKTKGFDIENVDHATPLTKEQAKAIKEELDKVSNKKFSDLRQKHYSDQAALEKSELAYNQLKNPETRKAHDEYHELRDQFRREHKAAGGTRKPNAEGSGSTEKASAGAGKAGSGHGEGNKRGGAAWDDDFWKKYDQSTQQRNQEFRDELEKHIKTARDAGNTPDLSKHNLFMRDLSNMDLEGCKFGNSLTDVKFNGANLKNADFSKKLFSNVCLMMQLSLMV